jgi:hypothetical protein
VFILLKKNEQVLKIKYNRRQPYNILLVLPSPKSMIDKVVLKRSGFVFCEVDPLP